MSRTLSSPSAGSTVVDKLKVYEGGTGATNATAAAAALGAIPASQIGVPGGIAGLTASGKLDPSNVPDDSVNTVSVTGPTSVIVSSTQIYEITNYDVFTEYTVEAIRGTVTLSGNLITYTAPSAVGAGNGGFKLNGRSIAIPVVGVKPNTPVLAGNNNGGTSVNPAVNGAASSYASNSPSSGYTHLNSDWQLASDAAFTNIVAQSQTDAVNKLGYTFNVGLTAGATYFIRVRYRDSNNGVSDWSNVVSVTAATTFFIQKEESRLVGPSASNSNSFGYKVAIDGTGTRIAVARRSSTSTAMSVLVLVRTGSVWSVEATLKDTVNTSDTNFGSNGITLSDNGSKLVVNGTNYSTYYTRSGSTWTRQGSISAFNSAGFVSCALSPDGTRLALFCYDNNSPYSGTLQIYTVPASGIPAYETQLANPNPIAYPNLDCSTSIGQGLCFSTDGSYLAAQTSGTGIGARVNIFKRTGTSWAFQQGIGTGNYTSFYVAAISGAGDRALCCYLNPGSNKWQLQVWLRTNNSWSQEYDFINVTNTSAYAFAMNSAGDQVVCNGAAGAIQVFTRTGTVWTLKTTLTPSTASGNTNAGGSYSEIKLSSDGTRAVLGCPSATSVNVVGEGASYIFST